MSQETLLERIVGCSGLIYTGEQLKEPAKFEETMCRGLARLLGPEPSEVCFRCSKLMADGRQIIECDALVLVDGNVQLVIEARYVHQLAQAILCSSPSSRKGLSCTAEFNLEAVGARASVAVDSLEILAINRAGEQCRFNLSDPAGLSIDQLKQVVGT